MSALYICPHLGLGDAFIVNGLVRVIASQGNRIIFPAKRHNAATVTWMFSDLLNVTVLAVRDDAHMMEESRGFESLKLGVHSGDYKIPKDWDAWFYRQAGIPHECRWREFKLPHTCLGDTEVVDHPYAFCHQDESRGYMIKDDAILQRFGTYFPLPSGEFRHHIAPLQRADEIHVIDSSFLCLADTIPTNAKRLVLHQYATAKDVNKRTGPPTLRKDWEILR